MRTHAQLLWLVMVLGSACGSLDNQPFSTGVIRGRVERFDSRAFASIVGHEELTSSLDQDGAFELRDVPLGPQEVLIVSGARAAIRLTVEVGGANAVELGVVEPKPTVHFEVHVRAPGGQRVAGTVFLDGTPISAVIRNDGFENEVELQLPIGCYDARAVVAGLGEAKLSACIEEGAISFERVLTMSVPDGSPGREGCVVSGCQGGLMCVADLSCE
ncbi:MAG: hypothetical protein QM817_01100 [Archangium sp.]